MRGSAAHGAAWALVCRVSPPGAHGRQCVCKWQGLCMALPPLWLSKVHYWCRHRPPTHSCCRLEAEVQWDLQNRRLPPLVPFEHHMSFTLVLCSLKTDSRWKLLSVPSHALMPQRSWPAAVGEGVMEPEPCCRLEAEVRRDLQNGRLPPVQPFHAMAYPFSAELALAISAKYAEFCAITASRMAAPKLQHPPAQLLQVCA